MKVIEEIHQYDPLFPFILMHQKKWHYSTRQVFHFHDWYELVYVHSGEGTFLIDKRFYDMKAGHLFVIPGNTIHHTNPSKESPYVVSVILFDPKLIHRIDVGEPYNYLQRFDIAQQSESYQIKLHFGTAKFDQQLTNIHHAISKQQLGYRHKVLGLFHILLIHLNDSATTTPSEDKTRLPSKSELWLKDILVYIDHHLSEELTLPILAKQALVSPEHFSRVFKSKTGMTIPQYINLKRVIKAESKMSNVNLTIPFIADSCGFRSLSHFHRTFKQHFNLTPGEYRAKMLSVDGS